MKKKLELIIVTKKYVLWVFLLVMQVCFASERASTDSTNPESPTNSTVRTAPQYTAAAADSSFNSFSTQLPPQQRGYFEQYSHNNQLYPEIRQSAAAAASTMPDHSLQFDYTQYQRPAAAYCVPPQNVFSREDSPDAMLSEYEPRRSRMSTAATAASLRSPERHEADLYGTTQAARDRVHQSASSQQAAYQQLPTQIGVGAGLRSQIIHPSMSQYSANALQVMSTQDIFSMYKDLLARLNMVKPSTSSEKDKDRFYRETFGILSKLMDIAYIYAAGINVAQDMPKAESIYELILEYATKVPEVKDNTLFLIVQLYMLSNDPGKISKAKRILQLLIQDDKPLFISTYAHLWLGDLWYNKLRNLNKSVHHYQMALYYNMVTPNIFNKMHYRYSLDNPVERKRVIDNLLQIAQQYANGDGVAPDYNKASGILKLMIGNATAQGCEDILLVEGALRANQLKAHIEALKKTKDEVGKMTSQSAAAAAGSSSSLAELVQASAATANQMKSGEKKRKRPTKDDE